MFRKVFQKTSNYCADFVSLIFIFVVIDYHTFVGGQVVAITFVR